MGEVDFVDGVALNGLFSCGRPLPVRVPDWVGLELLIWLLAYR